MDTLSALIHITTRKTITMEAGFATACIRAIGVSAICIPSTILTTTALVFIGAIFPVTLVSRNTLTTERTRCVRATCFHTALSHPFLALVDICEGIKYVNYPSHPKIEY